MNHASLFTGIGGFDLAAQWMGWNNVFQCEIDPFCQKVLSYHFPNTTLYGDIRELNGTKYTGKIDILTGGFPCQPFSAAGRRRGTEDNRFLWPEMLRVIREVRPTWIVAENVRGITSIDNGMVFERVCSELEENEYEVQPFCIPACSVQAPHKRDRIWFVANNRREQRKKGCEEKSEWTSGDTRRRSCKTSPDSNHKRLEGRKETRDTSKSRKNNEQHTRRFSSWDRPWYEVAAELCSVDDGLPPELDGITVPKWRKESLKGYGNAIVPQVAFNIFQSIQAL